MAIFRKKPVTIEAGYKKLAKDPEEQEIAEQRRALREIRQMEVELGMLDEDALDGEQE